MVYIPKVARLFFKLLLAPITKPYQQQRQEETKGLSKSSSISSKYLMFYIDGIRITTIDIDKVKRAAGYIRFRRKCSRVEI